MRRGKLGKLRKVNKEGEVADVRGNEGRVSR